MPDKALNLAHIRQIRPHPSRTADAAGAADASDASGEAFVLTMFSARRAGARRRQHPQAVRAVVVDDHPLYREGIVRALDAAGILVVAEGGTVRRRST
jgi:hypothetical protein